jgi:phosphate transport system protein
MISTDLERVGDLARNIAKSALRLSLHPEVPVPLVLVRLARSSQRMLHGALDAYSSDDPEAARGVLEQDDEVDRQQDEVVRSGLQEITGRPELASQGVDIIFVAKHLERVADHATNIAEDVILVTEARNVKHASKLGA